MAARMGTASISKVIGVVQSKGLRNVSEEERKAFYVAKIKQARSKLPKIWDELDPGAKKLEKERAEKSLLALRAKASSEAAADEDNRAPTDQEVTEHAIRRNKNARAALQREEDVFVGRLRELLQAEDPSAANAKADASQQVDSVESLLDQAAGQASSDATERISAFSSKIRKARRNESALASRRRARLEAGRRTSQPATDANQPPLSYWDHIISADEAVFESLHKTDVPVASLSHGLTRVLFNPGVHFLRDPRSGVYNFPRELEDLPPVEEFDFDKLPQYVTSSKDGMLVDLAKQAQKPFVGSTSSVVAMLCQIYFWVNKSKRVNLDMLTATWQDMDDDFSMGQKLPASVVLNLQDGVYAIDADKSMDATSDSNILAEYGHMMEKLVTTDHAEFLRFLKSSSDPAPSEADHRQAYQFSKTDRMVLRSQLDAHDTHLPNVTFDVKTRGSVAIRQDRLNHEEGSGYTIDKLHGPWESFEREYYDLIRSAFLKYQFQCRIGHMDGCFVAYHSTRRFFGFQYVPVRDMDLALFGSIDTGDQVFRLTLALLENILERATACFPGESIRLTFAAGKPQEDVLRVFVHPRDEAEPDNLEDSPRMVLLELKGWNYVDGQPAEQVVIRRPDNAGDAWIKPVWSVGFDVRVSSLQKSEEAATAKGEHAADATFASESSAEGTSEAVEEVRVVKADANEVDGALPPRKPSVGPLSPSRVLTLFKETREVQGMFSNLTLPTGISRTAVVAAADRLAKLKEEHAHDDDKPPIELDPSDLAIRFPIKEGLDYKVKPSLVVRSLRAKARSGRRRTQEREAKEDPDAGYAEIESVLRHRQGVRGR
ncbi:hypothetical protein OIV83_000142 [Microbotryomycetes sp. JL201]|nr:hypothetical protein OIV83_000142 [Microbotryomycetes sp. JL201]